MKYGHTVKRDGILYPAGTEVPVGEPLKVELTDDVPYGALEPNPDGSVKAYGDSGNVVGAVSAEEVEKLEKQAGDKFPEKPKRGRKPKEA